MSAHELLTGFRPWGQRGHFWIDTDLYARNVREARGHFNRSKAILAETGSESGRVAILNDPGLPSVKREWMLAFVELLSGSVDGQAIVPSAQRHSDGQDDSRKRLIDELSAATELLRFKHFLRGPSSNDDGSTTIDNAPS
jgi:hypothetical protein